MESNHFKCDSCVLAMIQGVLCHEPGCPNQERKCSECDGMYKPEFVHQRTCPDCLDEQLDMECEYNA